jgi:hypothetical protein
MADAYVTALRQAVQAAINADSSLDSGQTYTCKTIDPSTGSEVTFVVTKA